MANNEDKMNEQFLNVLLQNGISYLKIADELLKRNRNDLTTFQNVLKMMDNLSRHQTVLKEDLEILKELDNEIGLDEDMEEDEGSLVSEELDESHEEDIFINQKFSNWVHKFSSCVIHRKNLLTHLEIQITEKLNYCGKQLVLRSEVNRIFQNYRAMATKVLEQTKSIEHCLEKDARFTMKCEKLKGILARINEKQNFFWESE
ncbi:uncharacterized protein LOC144467545 [Augochlora pura]